MSAKAGEDADLSLPGAPEHSFILFAGCDAVLVGPRCVVTPDKSITFWVPTQKADEIDVELDGERRTTGPSTPVRGGFRFTLQVPPGARCLAVSAAGSGQFLSLELLSAEKDERLENARSLRGRGELDQARAAAEAALESSRPLIRSAAAGLLARIFMQRDDLETALRWFDRSLLENQTQNCLSGQYRDLTALAFMSIYRRRDFQAARKFLDRARALDPDDTEQRSVLPYYEGLLSVETGAFGSALASLDSALAAADRLGLEAGVRDARTAALDLLIQLGRYRDAQSVLDGLLAVPRDALPACRRAELANNLGWSLLLVSLGAPELSRATSSPSALLTEAVTLYERCEDPLYQALALASLARALAAEGDLENASRRLAESERCAPRPEPWVHAGRLDIAAELDLRRGAPAEALARYEEIDRLALKIEQPMVRWRAVLGRARALEALGDFDHAIETYHRAAVLLDELVTLVPLGAGRDDLAINFERASAEEISLLLRTGRVAAARDAARHSRMRLLLTLDAARSVEAMQGEQRERWFRAVAEYRRARELFDAALREEGALQEAFTTLPADELQKWTAEKGDIDGRVAAARRSVKSAFAELEQMISVRVKSGTIEYLPPAAGELVLRFHALPDGWVVFAESASGVRAERRSFEPARVGEYLPALLEPLAADIEAARRIVLLPHGALESAELETVRIGGRALGEGRELVYAVEAQRRSAAAVENRRHALVVAVDPTGALEEVSREGAAVALALRRRGWEVDEVFGNAATERRVLEFLGDPKYSLFHFAGHAVSEGRDGWESRLLLADGALTALDVLALGHAPREIVLSACSAGRASVEGRLLGLNLAQSFVLSGSQRVVAAVRPVGDRAAFAAMRSWYESPEAASTAASAFRVIESR